MPLRNICGMAVWSGIEGAVWCVYNTAPGKDTFKYIATALFYIPIYAVITVILGNSDTFNSKWGAEILGSKKKCFLLYACFLHITQMKY